MKCHYFWLILCSAVLSGCTAGHLAVSSVSYQSLRTDFAQPQSIPKDAKIAVEFFFNHQGVMQPVVYNLTSDVLILDQTKSFLIGPDGVSKSYYDPTVRTETTGSYSSTTSGNTFNLGGITNALGIGGAIGSLASATSVSSFNTEGIMRQNSVTITDQPHVHIGPKGCVAMSKAFPIEGIGTTAQSRANVVDISHRGSNLRFSVCVTYSVDDGATFNKLVTNFYLSSHITIPIDNKKVSNAFYRIYTIKPDALAENMFMFTMPNNIKKHLSLFGNEFIEHNNIYDSFIHGSLIDFQ